MNKSFYKFIIVFSIILLAGMGCGKGDNKENKENTEEKETYNYEDIKQVVGDKEMAEKMTKNLPTKDNKKQELHGADRGLIMAKMEYKYEGALDDVSGGKSSGYARADYENGEYMLHAGFANLMKPQNGDFYEGWVVRREPFDFISTGKIINMGGVDTNLYKSNKNYTSYDLYVLTLEPDDGDPAPAKHILEGVMKRNP